MSMVGALQDYLQGFSGMAILTDQVAGEPESCALMPTGNGSIERDVTGGCKYKNSYVLYACEAALDETDRANTHDLLERLQDWIEERVYHGDLPVLPAPFTAESVSASNGMLCDVMDNGLALYQIQIQMTFTRRAYDG